MAEIINSDNTIDSVDEVRRLAPSLIKAANADGKLAILAAANPIIAMEELGLKFADSFKRELQFVFRFPTETVDQLKSLEKQVHAIAGRQFDIDAPKELEYELFDVLGLPRPSAYEIEKHPSKKAPDLPSDFHLTVPLPQVGWGPKCEDPLEKLRGAHAIMEPLLSYRHIEASRPRLALPEVYNRIKECKVNLPVTRLNFRIVRDPTPD